MRIASPKPGFCSVCFAASPERRFVDCEADYDGAPVLDRETKTIAVLPWNGQLGTHDNMYICESCAEDIRVVLGQDKYSDTLRKQARKLQQLELVAQMERAARLRAEAERDEWKRNFEMAQPLDELNPKRRIKAVA